MKTAVRHVILQSLKFGEIPDVLSLMVYKPQTSLIINTLLNIGILMKGKLPDIYWDMNLSSVELRIVNYVYTNILRLYTSFATYPRGKDDTPRFWRSKERMATECHVSLTSFREGVRHLAELGLVTSMEPEYPEDNAKYCIGLSTNFMAHSFLKAQENASSDERYENLARYMYSRESIAYLKLDSDYPFKDFVRNEKEMLEKIRVRFSWEMLKRTALKGTRVGIHYTAIVGKRLYVEPKKTIIDYAREALKKYEYVLNPEERRIMEVKRYYEYKCRKVLGTSGFCCMSTKRTGWRENKKWKWLTRLYKQCNKNGWDYKVFIDAQFKRMAFFKRPQKYVYLNQFFSDGAISAYHRYVYNYKHCNSVTGKIKVKGDDIQSIGMEIVNKVVNDCESMEKFIKSAHKYPAYKELSPAEVKIMYFSQKWDSMSKYYLASIPWFLNWLCSNQTTDYGKKLINDISALQKSPTMMKRIYRIVSETERRLNLPKTMTLEN